MASDTRPDTAPNLTAAYGATAAAASAVGLAAFAVSYHGLFDLLFRLARLPWYLAVIGPLGVDFFALVGIAASFVMRHERRARRAEAGFVIGFALVLSIAGNWVDAVSRNLVTPGAIALAISPAVVFLSSHLVVVCRRSMEDHRRATGERTPEPDVDDFDDEPDSDPTANGRRPFDPQRYARRRARQGDTNSKIGRTLRERYSVDVTDRTVARWTEEVRKTDSEPAVTDA